ncbi:MAG: hypothetical protein LH610_07985 [Sphingomonas bacterium]|nr:hypothetical protein [Sphingomonas bacterium]
MHLKFVTAVALLCLPGVASAQSMNAEQFLKRANALKKKGPLALFSGGEVKTLMAEGQAAGKFAREGRQADLKAGRKPRFCPEGGVKLNSDEFMTRLAAIPAPERSRINMGEASIRILAAKAPCR